MEAVITPGGDISAHRARATPLSLQVWISLDVPEILMDPGRTRSDLEARAALHVQGARPVPSGGGAISQKEDGGAGRPTDAVIRVRGTTEQKASGRKGGSPGHKRGS